MILGLVLVAHGHLIMSSEVAKSVLVAPMRGGWQCWEDNGYSKVTPPEFKTPNRLQENTRLEGGCTRQQHPSPSVKMGLTALSLPMAQEEAPVEAEIPELPTSTVPEKPRRLAPGQCGELKAWGAQADITHSS